MSRLAVLLAPVALAGCIEIPGAAATCDPGEDEDGDGWACDDGDCDDGDPSVNPAHSDAWLDMRDEDCVGGPLTMDELLPALALTSEGSRPAIVAADHVFLFDPESGVPVQIRERDGGDELVYDGENLERGLGMALYPVFHTSQPDVDGELIGWHYSPALMSRTTTWTNGAFTGQTTVWIHPDGRMIRSDHVAVSFQSDAAPYDLSRFDSFDAAVFTWVDASGNTGERIAWADAPDAVVYAEVTTDGGWTCLSRDVAPTRAVAMGFPGDPDGVGPRVTRGEGRLALEYDWLRGATSVFGGTYGGTTILALGRDGDCAAVADVIADFLDPPTLWPVPPTTTADGAESTYVQEEGVYAVESRGTYAELSVTEPFRAPGVTIRVRMLAEHGVAVYRNRVRLAAGRDYLKHVEADDPEHVITIWLPDQPDAGTTYRIAGPGGTP